MTDDRALPRPPRPLRPALAVTDRFRTSTRLVALVLVLLVPGVVSASAFARTVGAQASFAEQERSGVRVVEPALLVLADVVAGRDPSTVDLAAAVAANPGLGVDDQLVAVEELVQAPEAGTPAGRADTAEAVAALVTEVGNSSNLILDPDLDSFYVMDSLVVQLPRALVAAAQAAAPDPGADADVIARQAVLAGTLSGAGASLAGDVTTARESTAADPAGLAPLDDMTLAAEEAGRLGTSLSTTLSTTLDSPAAADPEQLADLAAAATGSATQVLDDLLSARIDRLEAGRTRTLLVSLGGLLVAVWLAAAVWWRTRSDVALVLTGVTSLSSGDLTPRPLPGGKDEFGDIGTAVAGAREQLAHQQADLAAAAAEREEQIRATFIHTRTAEKQSRERAQTVITTASREIIQELNDVVQQVAAVRAAAGTIDQRVVAADAVTRGVVDQARAADEVVGALTSSLRSITGMAATIAGVAGQTKLLALNATIEAARAGEAGCGFTVVAEEVKALATATAGSTEQIATTVAEVENNARAVSTSITSMSAGISGIDEASEALRRVAAGQLEVVEALDRAMSSTMRRIEDMSDIAAQLERRRTERFPFVVDAVLVLGADRMTVRHADLGAGGTRVVTPRALRVGAGTPIEVQTVLDGRETVLPGHVVRVEPHGDGLELGVEFVALSPEASARLDKVLRGLETCVTS